MYYYTISKKDIMHLNTSIVSSAAHFRGMFHHVSVLSQGILHPSKARRFQSTTASREGYLFKQRYLFYSTTLFSRFVLLFVMEYCKK